MNSSQTLWSENDLRLNATTTPKNPEQSCLCLNAQCATLNARQDQRCRCCGSPLQLQERYRAIHEIGHGQFAKTYQAIDEQVDDGVCIIKQFFPKLSGVDFQRLHLARSLFEQEALILQRLGGHPQIPKLLSYVEENKTPFLIQEFVSGRSLYHQVKQTAATIDVESILLGLLPVLQFIHSHDIVHRDIKLGNIIHAATGQFWLIDFGSALHKNLGRFGISGTPGYAAPEQLQGQASPASDLYSLAVTCVSILSGTLLENALPQFESPHEFLQCLETHVGQTISPQLAQVLERMLQPQVGDRYQSAQEVLDALDSSSSTLSAPSVDYTQLQMLLAEEAYREADRETWRILLDLGDCSSLRMLTIDAIDRLPLADLRIIDQLWSTASQGKFGFQAQFRAYRTHGQQLHDFDYDRWQRFAEQVGWCDQGQWLGYDHLTFDRHSPAGHLPAVFVSLNNRRGLASGPLDWWRLGFISLMERLFL